MRFQTTAILLAALLTSPVAAQHLEKIDASKVPTVFRPDDLFQLPPNQWHYAKHLWEGSDPCVLDQCEAGFNSGDLAVSVEHSKGYLRIIAGFRQCAPVAFSEIETTTSPDRYIRSHIENQMKRVVKGAAKSCKVKAPAVANLSVQSMFPGVKSK